jgi:hypothetical protein
MDTAHKKPQSSSSEKTRNKKQWRCRYMDIRRPEVGAPTTAYSSQKDLSEEGRIGIIHRVGKKIGRII